MYRKSTRRRLFMLIASMLLIMPIAAMAEVKVAWPAEALWQRLRAADIAVPQVGEPQGLPLRVTGHSLCYEDGAQFIFGFQESVSVLEKIVDDRLTDVLIATLAEEDLAVRYWVAVGLRLKPDERAVPALCAALANTPETLDQKAEENRKRAGREGEFLRWREGGVTSMPAFIPQQYLQVIDGVGTRLQLIRALGEYRDHAAIDALVKQMTATNQRIKFIAIATLAHLGATEGMEPLLALAHTAWGAQQTLYTSYPPEAVMRLLLQHTRETPEHPCILLGAFTSLGETVIPELTRIVLHEEDVRLTRPALEALFSAAKSKPNGRALIEQILPVLQSDNTARRLHMIEALWRYRDNSFAPAIVPLLENAQPAVRAGTVEALAWLLDASSAEYLAAALFDQEEIVKRRAALELMRIAPAPDIAIPALLRALTAEADTPVTEYLVQALGRQGDARATTALLGCLNHRQYYVRYYAIQSLGMIGDPATRPVLLKIMRENRDEKFRLLAAIGLAGMDETNAIDYLLDAFSKPKIGDGINFFRHDILKALCKSIDPRINDTLLVAMQDTNNDIRRFAARALVDRHEERVIALMVSILLDKNGDNGYQQYIIETIASYGPAVIEPLHKGFLTDQWPGTMWTMQALAKIRDERCLPIYIAALAHHENNVRHAAIEGLKFNTGLELGWQPENWQAWWKEWEKKE